MMKEKMKWLSIGDQQKQDEVMKLCNVQIGGANDFVFWYPEDQPERWGLTIKSVPSKKKKSEFIWKITWTKSNYGGEEHLNVSKASSNMSSNVTGDSYASIKKLFEEEKLKSK